MRSKTSQLALLVALVLGLGGRLPASGTLDFVEAAIATNARLKTELEWEFGGKTQRGWELYTPLIASLIRLDRDWDERRFVTALASWQARERIAPTGILDHETWSRMMTTWQNRRIEDRSYPPRSRLVTAMDSDLYDPERPMDLRLLERKTYAAYKRMVTAARRDLGRDVSGDRTLRMMSEARLLKIVSAFRSREYQEQLRREASPVGRAGLALYSTHFTGCALDLYVGGEPVSTRDDNRALQTATPVYRWLAKNAGKFGFQPYFYEPWHWEYCPLGSKGSAGERQGRRHE
ncbi:MAG: D-alanyl-D-alanine carboxypeptidase family protein [Acidobacteriota bacterium]